MREFNFTEVTTLLLLAAVWTIVLSLIAFIGGGILGLLVTMMRIPRSIHQRCEQFISFVQGAPC
jgi:polar amino acid transport system permease protein